MLLPPLSGTVARSLDPVSGPQPSTLQLAAGWVSLGWYVTVWLVCALGSTRIRRSYRKPLPSPPSAPESERPFVTVLRPVKGADPSLDVCLRSTFLLDYPKSRYEVVLCVASPQDPAIPVIEDVIGQHPEVNARLLIGEEDVGPNPKIRNLSRGYREARGDIVWILDCNVWVPRGILSRSVHVLEGVRGDDGYKVVHHLPLCVDVTKSGLHEEQISPPSSPLDESFDPLLGRERSSTRGPFWSRWLSYGGGRLEENFLSSSHAKFYCAINTLSIASCVVGKSSMFRRSHLNEATQTPGVPDAPSGIVYFAENICEDNLIAEKLWLTPLEEERSGRRKWRKHALGNDLVFQPIERMSIKEYLDRRTRWIRVRKYSVLAATILEAGTECFVCSFIGGYAVTTVPVFRGLAGATWSGLWTFWGLSVVAWAAVDRSLFSFLHQYRSTDVDENSPPFIREKRGRNFGEWALQWFGRELLALPIWMWALWPGEVNWRGGRYRVRWKDMKVEEIGRDESKID